MPLNASNPRYFSQFAAHKGSEDGAPTLEGAAPITPADAASAKTQVARVQKSAAKIRHFLDEQDTEEGRVSSAAEEPGEYEGSPRRIITTRELLRRVPQA